MGLGSSLDSDQTLSVTFRVQWHSLQAGRYDKDYTGEICMIAGGQVSYPEAIQMAVDTCW